LFQPVLAIGAVGEFVGFQCGCCAPFRKVTHECANGEEQPDCRRDADQPPEELHDQSQDQQDAEQPASLSPARP
jgi:hypothetical protein